MDKVIENFECTISRHDWRNGRQTYNLHLEGSGISKEQFEEMLKKIVETIPNTNRGI